MKYLVLLLATYVTVLAHAKQEPEFYVRSTGHFCYQDFDDALKQVTEHLQSKAQKICKPDQAVRVTEHTRRGGGSCSFILEAGFICDSSSKNPWDGVRCERVGSSYIFKCCDSSGSCRYD